MWTSVPPAKRKCRGESEQSRDRGELWSLRTAWGEGACSAPEPGLLAPSPAPWEWKRRSPLYVVVRGLSARPSSGLDVWGLGLEFPPHQEIAPSWERWQELWETDLGTLALILLLPIKRRWLNLSVFCLITFRGSLDFEEVKFQTKTTCLPQSTDAVPLPSHYHQRGRLTSPQAQNRFLGGDAAGGHSALRPLSSMLRVGLRSLSGKPPASSPSPSSEPGAVLSSWRALTHDVLPGGRDCSDPHGAEPSTEVGSNLFQIPGSIVAKPKARLPGRTA